MAGPAIRHLGAHGEAHPSEPPPGQVAMDVAGSIFRLGDLCFQRLARKAKALHATLPFATALHNLRMRTPQVAHKFAFHVGTVSYVSDTSNAAASLAAALNSSAAGPSALHAGAGLHMPGTPGTAAGTNGSHLDPTLSKLEADFKALELEFRGLQKFPRTYIVCHKEAVHREEASHATTFSHIG